MNIWSNNVLPDAAIKLMSDIANQEAALEQMKGMLKGILENDLPEEMMDCGAEEFTHEGFKFTRELDVYAGMPADNAKNREARNAIFRFLTDNGGDSLIKKVITIEVGMMERAALSRFLTLIRELFPLYKVEVKPPLPLNQLTKDIISLCAQINPGPQVEETQTVHGGQLRAWIKAQIKAGRNIPESLHLYTKQVVNVEAVLPDDRTGVKPDQPNQTEEQNNGK